MELLPLCIYILVCWALVKSNPIYTYKDIELGYTCFHWVQWFHSFITYICKLCQTLRLHNPPPPPPPKKKKKHSPFSPTKNCQVIQLLTGGVYPATVSWAIFEPMGDGMMGSEKNRFEAWYTLSETNSKRTWKWMVGRWMFVLFSGANC